MDSGNLISYTLIYLGVVLIVILICREIACWYFKINKTIAVLEEIKELLKDSQQAARVGRKIEPIIGGINEAKEEST